MKLRVIMVACLTLWAGCQSAPAPEESTPSTTLATRSDTILAATWQIIFLDVRALSLVDFGDAAQTRGQFEGIPLAAATAFAVSSDTLVTNAHVVQGVLDLLPVTRFPNLLAIQHETGRTVRVDRAWIHPGYDPQAPIQNVPDVAILRVSEGLDAFLPIVDGEAAQALTIGNEVVLCGFPGGVTKENTFDGFIDSLRPRATCQTGAIVGLQRIDPAALFSPATRTSLRYGISTEPGSSGSAVVNDRGVVVGVHAFAFLDTGIGGGPRSDIVTELRVAIEADEVVAAPLENLRVFVFCAEANAVCTQASEACVFDSLSAVGAGFDADCPLCDADCDGWSDRSEVEFHADPCDPDVFPLTLDIPSQGCVATALRGTNDELNAMLVQLELATESATKSAMNRVDSMRRHPANRLYEMVPNYGALELRPVELAGSVEPASLP